MTNHADTVYTKQRNASLFLVIKTFKDILHSAFCNCYFQQITQPLLCIFRKLKFQQRNYRFAEFQKYVSRKTVADNNVHCSLKYISPLNISFEVEIGLLYKFTCRKRNLASL